MGRGAHAPFEAPVFQRLGEVSDVYSNPDFDAIGDYEGIRS